MTFYDKVNDLCKEHGISITSLALALGFSKGTPTNWKTMTKPPRAENVKKVADYFGVPTSYFNEATNQTIHDNHGIIGDTLLLLLFITILPILARSSKKS